MLFLCGGGISGLSTALNLQRLPPSIRGRISGCSGGALAALALAADDLQGIVAAVDRANWPGPPDTLRDSIALWASALPCGGSPTFATWAAAPGLQPLCVLAFNCLSKLPVLFSANETPAVKISEAVAAAAAWPGASSCVAFVDGVEYCDVEFYISPLELYRHLQPTRLLIVRGTSQRLSGSAARMANHHVDFMDEIARPLQAFVAQVKGPRMMESVLRNCVPSYLLPGNTRTTRGILWILICCLISFALCARQEESLSSDCTRRRPRGALETKKRNRIWSVRQTTVFRKRAVRGPVRK